MTSRAPKINGKKISATEASKVTGVW